MLPHVWRIWIDQVGDARDILELKSNTWCSTSNVWPRLLQQIEYRPWRNFSMKTLGVFVKKSRWEFLMLSWCFEKWCWSCGCWFLLGRCDLNEASIFTAGRENTEVWVSDFIPGSLRASMSWYFQVLIFCIQKIKVSVFEQNGQGDCFDCFKGNQITIAPVWKMILPWDISWYVSRTCFGVLDARHVPIPDPNSDCPWLGRIVRSLSPIQPKNCPNQTMKRIE